jgi:uncharacterized membrane protein YqjE
MDNQGGIISSLRRLMDGGLSLAQTRVELLGVELRQEQCRLVEAVLLAATLVAVGLLACTLLTLLVVIVFWDSARLPVLGVLIVAYAVAGWYVWRRLKRLLHGPSPFSGTVDQLRKDRACLQPEQASS